MPRIHLKDFECCPLELDDTRTSLGRQTIKGVIMKMENQQNKPKSAAGEANSKKEARQKSGFGSSSNEKGRSKSGLVSRLVEILC
jgi:hypothetical protein